MIAFHYYTHNIVYVNLVDTQPKKHGIAIYYHK